MSDEGGFDRWVVANLPVEEWPPQVYEWAIEHIAPSEWPPYLSELVGRVPEEKRAIWPAWRIVANALKLPIRLAAGGSPGLLNDRRDAARALSRNKEVAQEIERLRKLRDEMTDADPELDRYEAERRLIVEEILPFAQQSSIPDVNSPDLVQYLLIALRFNTTDPEYIAPFLPATQASAYANYSDAPVPYLMTPGEIIISVSRTSKASIDVLWPHIEAAQERLQYDRPRRGKSRSNLRERIYRRVDQLRTPSGKGKQRSIAKIAPMINREFRDELDAPLSETALKSGYARWVKENES